jgi:hypothetical protein
VDLKLRNATAKCLDSIGDPGWGTQPRTSWATKITGGRVSLRREDSNLGSSESELAKTLSLGRQDSNLCISEAEFAGLSA